MALTLNCKGRGLEKLRFWTSFRIFGGLSCRGAFIVRTEFVWAGVGYVVTYSIHNTYSAIISGL